MSIINLVEEYNIKYEILLALLIIVVLGFLYMSLIAKCKKVVKCKSSRYKEVCVLNDKYSFYTDIKKVYVYEKKSRSKYVFDKFDYVKFFRETIESEIEDISEVIFKINSNQKKYFNYCNEISNISNLEIDKEARLTKMPKSTYKSLEKKLFNQSQTVPILDTKFVCKTSYISPKKVNYYQGQSEFTLKELIENYDAVLVGMKEKSGVKEERRKLSPSIRYDILKRDQFGCVLCGRNPKTDGVRLHVDHIIPVSKGGKTEINNLRTLCEDCNIGKSDKYDELGEN